MHNLPTTSLNQRVLERIRAEYLEMPGMNLKIEQVQRLCGIERAVCRETLDSLVAAKFLYLKADGTYVRLTEGRAPLPRPAKAMMRSTALVTTSRRAS